MATESAKPISFGPEHPAYPIVEDFLRLLQEQHPAYVCTTAMTTLGAEDPTAAKEDEKTVCILVILTKQAPRDLPIPLEYKGYRVFKRFIGPFYFG